MKTMFLVLIVSVYSTLAMAQAKLADDAIDPPFAGVSKEDWEAARALYCQGNALYRESLFVAASEKFRESLKRCHCRHPVVYYNLALSLLSLDRPIELFETFQASIDSGLERMSKERFEAAKRYMGLLEKQLVRVKVRCDLPGAVVALDGKKLFEAPGEYEGWVRAGPHSILASKEGYIMANPVNEPLIGGTNLDLDVKLLTLEDTMELRRRWSKWKPWAVVGTGVVVGAGGVLLEYLGHKQVSDTDRSFESSCRSGGCPSPDLAKANRGKAMRAIGVGAKIVGGATLVTGFTLVYMNRLRPFLPPSTETSVGAPKVVVVPNLGLDGYGISATINF